MSLISLELRSAITPAGQLRRSVEEREVATPGPDEVVARVEAAPINPADLAVLIGPAALETLSSEGTAERPVTSATAPDRLLRLISGAVRARRHTIAEPLGFLRAAGTTRLSDRGAARLPWWSMTCR